MAYPQKASHLAFFSPDAAAPVIVIDVGAASANAGELSCNLSCRVKRVMFHVTDEAIGGTTTAPTVVFTKRPTPNSATSESVVATLTLPDTTAIGETIYADVDVAFDIGDVMEISHTVGVGTPTGQGIAAFVCELSEEVTGNLSEVTASA